MSELDDLHEAHGAIFDELDGRQVVTRYRRPAAIERTHQAVRNGVGVTELPYDVIVVDGADRVDYVDNVVTAPIPETDGRAVYAFLLNPQGRIETDLLIYHSPDRLLLFVPPGRGQPTIDGWETFIQDVELTLATERFVAFGVHGPDATPKLASVLTGTTPPVERFHFERGSFDGAGVTVLRADAPTGEDGYEVIARTEDAVDVFDTLLNRGMNAVPFGRKTWEVLTLEAGTPLFPADLEGRIPNEAGVRGAVDFEKGCFVGQEIVSRIENRGQPSNRMVGLELEKAVDPGATVTADGTSIGSVTRVAESPSVGGAIALAYVDFGDDHETVGVEAETRSIDGSVVELPFYVGSDRSGRIPTYPGRD